MEISRIKMIEDENLRLNQTIDKSNRGNIAYSHIYILTSSILSMIMNQHL